MRQVRPVTFLLQQVKRQQVQTICTEHCEILMPVCLHWFYFHMHLTVGTLIRLLKYPWWCLAWFCLAASHFCSSDTDRFHTEMEVVAATRHPSVCTQTRKNTVFLLMLRTVVMLVAHISLSLSLSHTAAYFLSLPLSHSAVWLLKPGRQTDRQCVHEE